MMEKPRLYFDFLNDKFGRGGLIIFTSVLLLQGRAVVIILAIVAIAIGFFGMLVGWNQGPDGKAPDLSKAQSNKSRNEKESAAPSSAAGSQKSPP